MDSPVPAQQTVGTLDLKSEMYQCIEFILGNFLYCEYFWKQRLPEGYERMSGKDGGRRIADNILFDVLKKINKNSIPILTVDEEIYFENLRKLQKDSVESIEILRIQEQIQKHESMIQKVEASSNSLTKAIHLIRGAMEITQITDDMKEAMEKMTKAIQKCQEFIKTLKEKICEMQKLTQREEEMRQKNKELEGKYPFFQLIGEGAFRREFLDEVEMIFTSLSKGQPGMLFPRSTIAYNLIDSKFQDIMEELPEVTFVGSDYACMF